MKIDTAVVLAGGQGDRLKPLTNGIPKAMVEINNKPLLQWVIEWLRKNDVTEIVLGDEKPSKVGKQLHNLVGIRTVG
jgi:NDP-sugar pyrophosphorylase family protein